MSRSFVVGKRSRRVVFGPLPGGFGVANWFCADAVVNAQTRMLMKREKERQSMFIE
jgi:hypothetical protein